MSRNISSSKGKALVYSFLIAFGVALLVMLFDLIMGISFSNIYSLIIMGSLMGLAINLSSRFFYKKSA